MVLLKNSNKALPLSLDQLKNKKIALIDPTANATVLMQGNYHGLAPYLTSPLVGFQTNIHGYSIDIQYTMGCQVKDNDTNGFTEALEVARFADVVIFCAGLNLTVEREDHDRVAIVLPDIQMILMQELEKVLFVHQCMLLFWKAVALTYHTFEILYSMPVFFEPDIQNNQAEQ